MEIQITENQKNNLFTLNESLTSKVYHFTSLSNVYNIVTSDTMFCQYSVDNADYSNDNYNFYISFTRNKSPYEGFGYHQSNGHRAITSRIEFDGDKLSNNFKGGAYNYWGAGEGLMNKWWYQRRATGAEDGVKNNVFHYSKVDNVPNDKEIKHIKNSKEPFVKYPTSKSPEYIELNGEFYEKTPLYSNIEKLPFNDIDIKNHVDNEFEDRILTNKSTIENISQYITRIDILINTNESLSHKLSSILYYLASKNSVYIYDNLKDFNFQTENTINTKISDEDNSYEKYGDGVPQKNKKGVHNFDLARIMQVLSLLKSDEERIPFAAKLLKQYGIGNRINSIAKELKYPRWYSVDELVSNSNDILFNYSKNPNEEGQLILQIVSDELRRNGFKSLRDYAKAYKEKYKSNQTSYDNIDTISVKKFKVFKNGYTNYDITNDNETDIWHLLGCYDLNDNYRIVDNIIEDINYYLGYEYYNNLKSGSLENFRKYLQSLAHQKVTFKQFISLLKKIGLNGESIRGLLGYPKIFTKECDYWDYRLQPPFKCNDEFKYRDSKFQKQNTLNENTDILNNEGFKSWFGNSLAVDKEGNPLEMHHLTNSEFDTFSHDHIKGGSQACYGFGFNFSRSGYGGYGSNDIICFLKAEHPLTNKEKTINRRLLTKIIKEIDSTCECGDDTIVNNMVAFNPDMTIKNPKYDLYLAKTVSEILNYSQNNLDIYGIVCQSFTGYNKKVAIDVFNKYGFDSAIEYDKYNDLPSTIVVFYPNQIKSVKNTSFNNDEMSYLKETTDLFPNTKVRNEDGSLKSMYRGDDNDIETFDRSHSASSNLYGTGFYFTDDEHQASVYGRTTKYYLNIENPLSTDKLTITPKMVLKFLKAIDKNEDYGLYNYGYGSTPQNVLEKVYSTDSSDFSIIQDINASCIGDMVEATLLFNKLNKTAFDGFILSTETVVFDNSQIMKANDLNENVEDDEYMIGSEGQKGDRNMNYSHVILKEKSLKESLNNIDYRLYHFTWLQALPSILKRGSVNDFYNDGGISVTRNKNSNVGYPVKFSETEGFCRISFNPKKLLSVRNITMEPVSYFGDYVKVSARKFVPTVSAKQLNHSDHKEHYDEAEEKIRLKKIPLSCCENIDILLPYKNKLSIVYRTSMRILGEIFDIAKITEYTDRIRVFKTREDLNFERNYISINELFDSNDLRENVKAKLNNLLCEWNGSDAPSDLSNVGEIWYDFNYDEDDYQEYLTDNELEDTEENKLEYIIDNVEFNLDFKDNEYYHSFAFDSMYYRTIEELYGESIAKRILNDCLEDGKGKFDTLEMIDTSCDINNPGELCKAVKSLLPQEDRYRKGFRGFVLTDGTLIKTDVGHEAVERIDGIKNWSHFVRLGNIRLSYMGNSNCGTLDVGNIITMGQAPILRQIIAAYSDESIAINFFNEDGTSWLAPTYYNPDYNEVYMDIYRYYKDGIKPTGGHGYLRESVNKKLVISESQKNRIFLNKKGCRK